MTIKTKIGWDYLTRPLNEQSEIKEVMKGRYLIQCEKSDKSILIMCGDSEFFKYFNKKDKYLVSIDKKQKLEHGNTGIFYYSYRIDKIIYFSDFDKAHDYFLKYMEDN